MEAALTSVFTSVGGLTQGAAAVKAGSIMSGVSTAATYGGMGMSLLSGIQQNKAYAAQATGVKEQQYAEKLKAQEEGNLRRERLLDALAAQNVRSGVSGVGGETPSQIALQSVEEYEKEQLASDVMYGAKQRSLSRQADAYKSQGKSALGKSLLSTATKLEEIG